MGLSPSDVAGLAETLAAGKHPTVVFTESAGQIAGRTGKVVRLEEPAVDDFVVVRFGHDELPFSVAEVRVPQRGELGRKQSKTPQPQERPPAGPPLLDDTDNAARTGARRGKESTVSEVSAEVPRQSDAPAAAAPAPAPRKKATKAKASPELSVTLTWSDNQWQVSASKGTKVIAKPVPVKATTAVAMVQSLDSPAVAAVVEDIVEQQRADAARQAEELRAQLAAVEARLAELA